MHHRHIIVGAVLIGAGVAAQFAGAQPPEEPDPSHSFVVGAWEFDRGNVHVMDVGSGWADTERVLLNAEKYPNFTEYDLDFPVAATYRIDGRYASEHPRPVDIYLDGELLVTGFSGTTGSFMASSAMWEEQCTVRIEAGRHTFRLECPSCVPHITALRFVSDTPFPEGFSRTPKAFRPDLFMVWDGNPIPGRYGYQAYVHDDGYVDAPAVYDPLVPYEWIPLPTPRGERVLEYLLMEPAREIQREITRDGASGDWIARLSVDLGEGRVETEALVLSQERMAGMLEHARLLATRFEDDGVDLGTQVFEIDRLTAQLDSADTGEALYELYVSAYRLKHEVALSNPLLDLSGLLFVRRQTYDTSHIYTTYFDGSHRYGGDISILSPIRPDGRTRSITTALSPDAIYRDPDVSFDGSRVLFSYKPDLQTPCRIYEVGIDGTDLRQLTDSPYDDIDPCYLPDGRIMFVSTRCRRVVLCHNAFTVSVLYLMNGDGSDVRCISQNTVNDFTPSVLHDGRVAYTRWEYVDKNLGNNQSLWTVNPDGGRPSHIAGEHWGPITLWEPRAIPNSPLLVTTLAPHMPIAVGPIALVDPADVCASPAKFENITREQPPPRHFGWLRPDAGYYCNPYPLSEDFYIVSYAYGPDQQQPEGYGIYLLDRWNNRDLIYRDPGISCFEAFPIDPRPTPPVIAPTEMAAGDDMATVSVLDVYAGLDGIARGEVKYLRILQEEPKPVAAECSGPWLQYPVISNGGHLAVKTLLGTVPVEEDGSALFRAPADRPLYFAALDGNYMEVQRMRAFTEFRAGESVTCIGCHEHRDTAPPNSVAMAMRRAPSEIEPPPGGPHAPDFAYDVQPVLDRNCIDCHGGEEPAGGLDLSLRYTNLFSTSYEALATPQYTSFIVANDSSTLPLRPPKYYGSHASRLFEVLRTTHADRVDLSKDDWRALVTWVDCNAPYYGTYLYSRPNTLGGRDLLTPGIGAELSDVFANRCSSCHGEDVARAHRVNFNDVEESPVLLAPLSRVAGGTQACGEAVLETLDDPDAQRIVSALRRLEEEIRTNPRMDMLATRPPVREDEMRYVYRP